MGIDNKKICFLELNCHAYKMYLEEVICLYLDLKDETISEV